MKGYTDSLTFYEHFAPNHDEYLGLYYEAALKHSEVNPDGVRKIFDGETCVGLIDCDTEKGAHANYGWVSFLYLTEAYRGKGYGIQVLGRAIVLYRNLGRTALRLHVSSSNTLALRFYENCGFSILSSESGSEGPLYLMEKKIGSGRILKSIR